MKEYLSNKHKKSQKQKKVCLRMDQIDNLSNILVHTVN